ncbi:MAG TPA: hypothetical protein VGD71_28490 [Kribbella sp.]|jgi:hypothetical protein
MPAAWRSGSGKVRGFVATGVGLIGLAVLLELRSANASTTRSAAIPGQGRPPHWSDGLVEMTSLAALLADVPLLVVASAD